MGKSKETANPVSEARVRASLAATVLQVFLVWSLGPTSRAYDWNTAVTIFMAFAIVFTGSIWMGDWVEKRKPSLVLSTSGVITLLLFLYAAGNYSTVSETAFLIGFGLFFLIVVIVIPVFIVIVPLLLFRTLMGLRVRFHLQSKGFDWMGINQAGKLYFLLGERAFRLPPYEHLATLPDYVEGDVDSIAKIADYLQR